MLSTLGQPCRRRVTCDVIAERHANSGSRSALHSRGQCNERSVSFGVNIHFRRDPAQARHDVVGVGIGIGLIRLPIRPQLPRHLGKGMRARHPAMADLVDDRFSVLVVRINEAKASPAVMTLTASVGGNIV